MREIVIEQKVTEITKRTLRVPEIDTARYRCEYLAGTCMGPHSECEVCAFSRHNIKAVLDSLVNPDVSAE